MDNKVGIVPFLLLLSIAFAQHHHEDHGHHEHEEHEEHHVPNYKFEYKVDDKKTGDFKSHRESREGDKVDGYYMLKEADGTLREVHYSSDKHAGFNAVVTKSGTPSVHNEKEEEEHKGHAVHYGHVEELHKPHYKQETEQHHKPQEVHHSKHTHFEEPKEENKKGHLYQDEEASYDRLHYYPYSHEGRYRSPYSLFFPNANRQYNTEHVKRDLQYRKQQSHGRLTDDNQHRHNYEVIEK